MGPMRNHLTRMLTAGALAGTLILGVVGVPPAGAQQEPGARIRDRCIDAVDVRLNTLENLTTHTGNARGLTDPHRTALTEELAAASAGLTGLRDQLVAAGLAELGPLCRSVFEDYRVYVLEVPTTFLTTAGDGAVAVADRIDQVQARLGDGLARLAEAGFDVSELRAQLSTVTDRTAAARSAAADTGDQVLPLTPTQYNEGTARPVLEAHHDDLRSARDSLVGAVDTIRAVADAIRDLSGSGR